ncbi:MAG: FeS-binding protein [Desulfobacteraceae bacterium]|jgi:hypothetical protein|nr:MAG: FeS-binding protein [Desulfobacteraceae bacterium]
MNTAKKLSQTKLPEQKRFLRRLYVSTLIVLAFTGFGQMPIFKRYGISSIPGMGWSADFYTTHYIHYIGAIVLLALITYALTDFLVSGRKTSRLTIAAYVQIILLSGIVITGIFRVLKNLPDVVFSPAFTMFIDLAHLGLMIFYMVTALIFLLTGRKWLNPRLH